MRDTKETNLLSKILLVLAIFSLTFGVIAGILDNNLLNGPRFADHVESVSKDPAVVAQLSVSLADVVIEKSPIIGLFRPVVERVASQILASDALREPIRYSALELSSALVSGQPIELDLTDAANTAINEINMLAPQLGLEPISEFILEPPAGSTLATVNKLQPVLKSSNFLSQVLPVVAFICFLSVILLATNTRKGIASVAKSITASGVIIAGLSGIIWAVLKTFDNNPNIDIYLLAIWNQFQATFWIAAALLLIIGLVMLIAAKNYKSKPVS